MYRSLTYHIEERDMFAFSSRLIEEREFLFSFFFPNRRDRLPTNDWNQHTISFKLAWCFSYDEYSTEIKILYMC